MKKSLFNTLGAIGIMSLIALNVYVVTSKETPALLKWDAMSYIFAKGNSGSGSGSENGSDDEGECDQCVVKRNGTTRFSCKREGTDTCTSPSYLGATVSCANAVEC